MLHLIIMKDTAYCNSQKDRFFQKITRGHMTKMLEVYCSTSVTTGTSTWTDYANSTHAENKEIMTPFSTTPEGNTENKLNTVMTYGLHNRGRTGPENEERTFDFTSPGSREGTTTDAATDSTDPQNEEMKMTFDFTYSGPRESTTIVTAGTSNFTTEHSTVPGIGLIHQCINTVVIIVGIITVIVMVSSVNFF